MPHIVGIQPFSLNSVFVFLYRVALSLVVGELLLLLASAQTAYAPALPLIDDVKVPDTCFLRIDYQFALPVPGNDAKLCGFVVHSSRVHFEGMCSKKSLGHHGYEALELIMWTVRETMVIAVQSA